MRPLSPRVAVAALLAAALVVTTPAPDASAASRPGTVGLVSFTGASLTPSGATLTVDWPDVPGAAFYEVYASRTFDFPAGAAPRAKVSRSQATISGLARGTDYYVYVRAVNAAGPGPRSWRVGHSTIAGQASLPAGSPRYKALTWNVCSTACASFSSRAKIINSRISELKPDIVALQEASKYTKAPSGYSFAYNGQNDILLRSSVLTKVRAKASAPTSGYLRPAKKYAAPGRGFAWAAVRHTSGQYMLVVDVHLVTGSSRAAVKQRAYEAGRVGPYIARTLAALKKSHGSLTDWSAAPVLVLGDLNTHKSHTTDPTLSVLRKAGWRDAFDQARSLSRQHHSTANPTWTTAPVIGVTWGNHVDKVLVRASRSVVYRWEVAGKMSKGRYVAPLGSDHHPLLVEVGLK